MGTVLLVWAYLHAIELRVIIAEHVATLARIGQFALI